MTKKARTGRAILEAASASVSEHGLHGASVEDIARRADVAVGSIYVHYGSKDGLFRAVIDDAVRAAEALLLATRRPGRTPIDRLVDLGDAYVEFALAEPTAFRLVALQLLDPRSGEGDRAIAPIEGSVRKVLAHMTGDIRAATAAGQLPAVPPRLTATFLWGSWTGVLSLTLGEGELGADAEQVRATMRAATLLLAQGATTVDFTCDADSVAA